MDVEEFVAEALKQITNAIRRNDSTFQTGPANIENLKELKIFSCRGGCGFVTYVDFDIAVTESSSKEDGAKLSVLGVGAFGGDLTKASEVVSKIKFRVPLQIRDQQNGA